MIDVHVDRVADKVDVPVGEDELGATRVITAQRQVVRVVVGDGELQ